MAASSHSVLTRSAVRREHPTDSGRGRFAFRLGQISGIGVYVHPTFLLLVGWVALSYLSNGHGVHAALAGVLFVLAVFAIVVLHELGHSLAARRYGIGTRDITLLPIGGVARLERMPTNPVQELVVGLAGPAVNVVLAGLCLAGLVLSGGRLEAGSFAAPGAPLLSKLFFANVTLAAFNLLPAFPMDGGRVFRALLALRLPHARATELAARTGQAIAVLLGFAGVFTNPMLVLIGVFVWLGAHQEATLVAERSALEGLFVDQAMITDFRTLAPGDPLAHAAELGVVSFQRDFPVVADGVLVGVLTRSDLVNGLSRAGALAPVSLAMRTDVPTVDPGDRLEAVLTSEDRFSATMVVRGGRLFGILLPENLAALVRLRSAARPAERRYA
jgi:Zn-dependent protease/CBS domain-containing protein